MRNSILVVLLVVMVALLVYPTSAKDKKESLTELISRAYKAPGGTFLLTKSPYPERAGGGLRVVYVHNGVRYTLDHNGWADGIQIWLRPNGTSDVRLGEALADENMDGEVNFGTDGAVRIYSEPDQFSSTVRGAEHKPYWQTKYDEALAGLKETLDGNM